MSDPHPIILAGPHATADLAAHLRGLGKRRVLILCSRSRRFVRELADELSPIESVVFDGAAVHVPADLVDEALAAFDEADTDTVVAVGGGSAIGLAKAMRLARQFHFVAVPTTYAGSELTSIYGVTRSGQKTTGRDDRVRPDVVIRDLRATVTLPLALSIRSLANALAHPVSALSTGTLTGQDHVDALAASAMVVRTMEDLLLDPHSEPARRAAVEGASACARVLDHGSLGTHHRIAHVLGAALGLDHAAVHAVLLPQTLFAMREDNRDLYLELEGAVGVAELDGELHDLLRRSGCAWSLAQLGVERETVQSIMTEQPELPAELLRRALVGTRPTSGGTLELGDGPPALYSGPAPAEAKRVIVAVHGGGSDPGSIVRLARELCGRDPDTCVVGISGADASWFSLDAADTRNADTRNADHPAIAAALDRLAECIDRLRPQRGVDTIDIVGQAQGAWLAIEHAARHPRGLGSVIAIGGARFGPSDGWSASEALDQLTFVLGAASSDSSVTPDQLRQTTEWLRAAGAQVTCDTSPTSEPCIPARIRLRARDSLVSGSRPVAPIGYGATHVVEALAGAVPARQNSPRRAPHGLYPEQINGSGFTALRPENLRTWLYRVRPSTQRQAYSPLEHATFTTDYCQQSAAINLTGLDPLAIPEAATDFVDGMVTVGGAGSPGLRRGFAIHMYACNRSMEHRAFYDADGELLIVPQHGALTLLTECGALDVAVGSIALIPRGMLLSVLLRDDTARGFVAETYGRHFHLPERGLIGSNGLADPRHFRGPLPYYEDRLAPDFRITAKLDGVLHEARQDHSPYDVCGYHGNYIPYVYDLTNFSPSANVRFDHGDPSVFTVLASAMDETGHNGLDFIAFPARWDSTKGTFRPPFFHRSATTELNAVIREDTGPDSPFAPGSCFLTPCLTPHGVAGTTVERIRQLDDETADRTMRLGSPSLWIQFETTLPMALSKWAMRARRPSWPATWGSHRRYFAPGIDMIGSSENHS